MNIRITRFFLSSLFVIITVLQISCTKKVSVHTATLNKVTVANNDTILTFGVWNQGKEIKPNIEKRYHYYIRNSVKSSQGHYMGKPLDGNYQAFTRSNILTERGEFSKGLKHGKWIRWYSNGNIHEIVRWKYGIPSGKFESYSVDGRLIEKGKFRKGKIVEAGRRRLRFPEFKLKTADKGKVDNQSSQEDKLRQLQSEPAAVTSAQEPPDKKKSGKSLTKKKVDSSK